MSSLRTILQGIHAERGELTPEIVVMEARAVDHPLHNRFEWDNKLAGDAWRREQAHRLIQSVRISYQPAVGGPRDVRAFVAVPRAESAQPSYEPIESVLADPIQRKIVMQAMEREWRTLKGRYESLTEFADMVLADIAPERVAS